MQQEIDIYKGLTQMSTAENNCIRLLYLTLLFPPSCSCSEKNERFLSTGMEFSKNVYAYA